MLGTIGSSWGALVMDDNWFEEEGVPTWLETPATNIAKTLLTIARPQLLPLNDLTWENFERLCLRYVRGRGGVVRTQLYGVKGQAQHGIDLYVRLVPNGAFITRLTFRKYKRGIVHASLCICAALLRRHD